VDYEIERSLKDGNGLVAIKVDDSISDEDVPDKLKENGAEIVDWKPDEFSDAIERAASQPRPSPARLARTAWTRLSSRRT